MTTRAENFANRLREQAGQITPPAPPPTVPAPAPATPQESGAVWSGAVPKDTISRTQINIGVPDVLNIPQRLALLKAHTKISGNDACSEAIDKWLKEKGF